MYFCNCKNMVPSTRKQEFTTKTKSMLVFYIVFKPSTQSLLLVCCNYPWKQLSYRNQMKESRHISVISLSRCSGIFAERLLLNLPEIFYCPRRCSPFWSCASREPGTCFGQQSADPCIGQSPPALSASWQTGAWEGCRTHDRSVLLFLFVCYLSVFKGALEQERGESEQEIETSTHSHRHVTTH